MCTCIECVGDQPEPTVAELFQRTQELELLSVTNIMTKIVPGDDGMGEEVYARSVDEITDELFRLSERNEELQSLNTKLRALLVQARDAMNSVEDFKYFDTVQIIDAALEDIL